MCVLHIPGAYFAIDYLLNVECICFLEQTIYFHDCFSNRLPFTSEIEETESAF